MSNAKKVHAYVRDADDTIEWIEEKDLLVSSEDYGHDLVTVQALIVKQEGFEVSTSVLIPARQHRGAVGRVSDLRARGRGFESRPGTQRRNPGQVSHTYVPLFTKQYKLVPAKGR